MGVFDTVRFIVRHPLGRKHPVANLVDWARWQIGSRLAPGPVIVPWIGSTRLVVSPGMAGATGNIYVGLHEPDEMGFLLHLLRAGDHFIDVGANIGSFTILAAGVVGAKVDTFEPVGEALASLARNIRVNALELLVCVHAQAVGDHLGEVLMETGRDSENKVVGGVAEEPSTGRQRVPLTTLDASLPGAAPTLIKIDVEGFERQVLAGAPKTLARTAAVLIEVSKDPDAVYAHLTAAGLLPARYDALRRQLEILDAPRLSDRGNALFVRDAAFVSERCRTAPRIAVKRTSI